MAHSIGPKEQQRIDLRLKRHKERGPGARALTEAAASKPLNAPVQASAPIKESLMKKVKATAAKMTAKRAAKSAAKQRGKSANTSIPRAKKADARARAGDKKVVPALDVARFMARDGGASMAELVKQFGIEAHPMRAKVHYVRNQIAGWSVETKDGRYYATGPAGG